MGADRFRVRLEKSEEAAVAEVALACLTFSMPLIYRLVESPSPFQLPVDQVEQVEAKPPARVE